jgi:hypothetical protein
MELPPVVAEAFASLARTMETAKKEQEAARREHNQKWGEIANRLGSMAEDLVAPSVERIVQEVFGVNPIDTDLFVNVRARSVHDRARTREFDAIVLWPGHVLLNETKSKLRQKDIDDTLAEVEIVREFFPQYADRKLYLSVAALSADDSIVRYAEDRGVLVLAVGDQLMDVRNTKGFQPRAF